MLQRYLKRTCYTSKIIVEYPLLSAR
jgi:hypothetical protein